MIHKQTTYDIVHAHLTQSENERKKIVSSTYFISETIRAHNKGMCKAYRVLIDSLEQSSTKAIAYELAEKGLSRSRRERVLLMCSTYTASDVQYAHNKGMSKAYYTIIETLDRLEHIAV